MRSGLVRLLAGIIVLSGILLGTGATARADSSSYAAISAPPAHSAAENMVGRTLTDVSCPAVGDCLAVGYQDIPGSTNGGTRPIVEIESHGVWSGVDIVSSQPYNESGQLLSVSCAAVGSCVAVGYYGVVNGSSGGGALIDTLSGGQWTVSAATTGVSGTPSAYEAELTSVSCPTTASCEAVGDVSDINLNTSGLLETLSSGTWTGQIVAAQSIQSGDNGLMLKLADVSCATAQLCVAVGNTTDEQGNYTGTIVADNNSTITPFNSEAGPNGNGENNLYGVACQPSGVCIAVGSYAEDVNGKYPTVAMAETRAAGGAWAAPTNPAPDDAYDSTLQSISCDAHGTCAAVGNDTHLTQQGYLGDTDGLVLSKEAGGSWAASEVPAPANGQRSGYSQEVYLLGVSCGDDTSCVAGGYYSALSNDNGNLTPLLVTMSPGVSATGMESPLPSDDSVNSLSVEQLSAVDCVDSSDCTGVGFYVNTSSTTAGLIVSNTSSATPPAPTVTAISPNQGSTGGGTVVTVTGTNLVGETSVDFGSVASDDVNVQSDSELLAYAPAHSDGLADITVTTPGGTSATSGADIFTYGTGTPPPTPTVSSVSPPQGPSSGGTDVTIRGSNLSGATAVHFGSATATHLTAVSATELKVHSPSHAPGKVSLSVTTPDGQSAGTSASHFTFIAAPTVTDVSPGKGTHKGGTKVTITGTGFSGASTVRFGSDSATDLSVVSPTKITVKTLAHKTGGVDVRVTTPGGTSATTNKDRYSFT